MLALVNSKKITKSDWISWIMLVVLFLYMFALNFLMPLHRDDYEYSLIWGTLQKITTMPEVFQSLQLHYFSHGGRMVDFFVLDSFLLWGKEWFNPFNAFLFVALIVLVYWHSQHKISLHFNPYILGLVIMFCWFGLPDFALVNIWMTGACVYLLTAVLIFAFLLPYHFELLKKPILGNGRLPMLGMFLFGVIAGWTIENTAATMNFILAAQMVYSYKKKCLKNWMVGGFTGSVLGFLLLVMAPGNYVRYGDQKTPLLQHLINQFGGGIELLLGLLPALIFLLLTWRIALVAYGKVEKAAQKEVVGTDLPAFRFASMIRIALICLMLLSKMNGSFLSCWGSAFLYDHVLVTLGIMDGHLKAQLFTTFSGLEELSIYVLLIVQFTVYIFRKWQLGKRDIQWRGYKAAYVSFLSLHPMSYQVVALLSLALLNNLVMIAAPAFPGRAGFGSAVFFIIGVMTMFQLPRVKEFLLSPANKKILVSVAAISVLPMAAAVLYQHVILHIENDKRMALLEAQRAQGTVSLVMEPLSIKNEILRHVYFVDLNNSVSQYGFCRYYQIKELVVSSKRTPE